jgi:hypothetical protein
LKTLSQLFKEFEGKTDLQRDEHVKKLTGTEVQIVGELSVIASDHISCGRLEPEVSYGNSIHIEHHGEQLRKQLLEYSSSDGVSMSTRFTGARFGVTDYYTFTLVSIVRLYTREMKEREKDAANLGKAQLGGVLGSLAGAVGGFVTGLGLNIVFALIVLPIYDWHKYGLGSPKTDSQWQLIVIVIATVGGAILGCYDAFTSVRRNRQ